MQRAVTLCVEALPDLTGPDRVRAHAILAVTLLPLARHAAGNRDRGMAVNACATLLAAIEAREFGGLRDGVVEVLRSVGEGLSGDPASTVTAGTPPPEVAWPTERYSASPEAKKGGGGIVAFLERVWREPIETQGVDLRTLRGADPAAAMAVSNLRRTGKTLPAHLVIPTLAEKHDKEALIFQDPGQRPARLDWALRRRAWRAGKKSTL